MMNSTAKCSHRLKSLDSASEVILFSSFISKFITKGFCVWRFQKLYVEAGNHHAPSLLSLFFGFFLFYLVVHKNARLPSMKRRLPQAQCPLAHREPRTLQAPATNLGISSSLTRQSPVSSSEPSWTCL